ncbi:unnamed protein product [Colias eurytheme]|nr:unnamed protein product [Colias eurytheme]
MRAARLRACVPRQRADGGRASSRPATQGCWRLPPASTATTARPPRPPRPAAHRPPADPRAASDPTRNPPVLKIHNRCESVPGDEIEV